MKEKSDIKVGSYWQLRMFETTTPMFDMDPMGQACMIRTTTHMYTYIVFTRVHANIYVKQGHTGDTVWSEYIQGVETT